MIVEPAGRQPPPAPSGQKLGVTHRRKAPKYLWALTIAILVPILFPVVYLVLRVVRAGPEGWAVLFSSRTFELLVNTLWLVTAVTITASTLGVTVAWLVSRTDVPGRKFWATALALPLVVPSYVGALALLGSFGPGGAVTDLLSPLGMTELPVPSGFWAAWLVLSLFTYPYVYLVAAPALRRMDPALEDAARGMGASRLSVFRTIALPQLRPALVASSLLVGLYTLSEFGAVSLLQYDTFTRAIYLQYSGRIDRTPALVLSAVLILIAAAILWAEQRSRGGAAYFGRGASKAKRLQLTPRGRIATLAFLAGLLITALIGPVSILLWWVVRGLINNQTLGPLLDAAGGSAFASSLAAVAALVASIPVAILAVRYRSRPSVVAERAVWSIYALPHITVGLVYVIFAANFTPAVYQTLPLLTVAYVAMFLPQASGAAQASLLAVNPHLEEVSRSLGHSHLATLRKIGRASCRERV